VSERWVINASPIILLAKAGLIEHVPELADLLVIPEPVATEIMGARAEDPATRWLKEVGTQFVRPAVHEIAELSGLGIGSGERAVISWAVTHSGFLAVLDDHEARVAAKHLGVSLLGTVGVVVRLKKAGLISAGKPHLLRIEREGGYIGKELFKEALRRAGESLD
jgi:predicted nucleic acid-binding protein